jgi:CxxC motif-containing protein (DUF1111 family)
VTELRTGRRKNDRFHEALDGSLIQSRATHPACARDRPNRTIVEGVAVEDNVLTFRLSNNTLGSGFVECIADSTLVAIRDAQPPDLRGTAVMAPVLEASDSPRVGRFGWKSQHASLQSFAAEAYLNEWASPLLCLRKKICQVAAMSAGTIRSTTPRTTASTFSRLPTSCDQRKLRRAGLTAAVRAGQSLFNDIGCATCHTPSITTAPAGTPINGGAFQVPTALGNKVIRPYSDFLLHDIGTGDGIPTQPTPEAASTANQMRTAPLWALRTRNRLMHDGLSFTTQDAISRHAGQATGARQTYEGLAASQKMQIQSFLDSL